MKRKAFYCICVAAPITFVGAVLAFYRCRRKKRYIVRESWRQVSPAALKTITLNRKEWI